MLMPVPPAVAPRAENCYLTDSSVPAGGTTVTWSIPGFQEYSPDEGGVHLYTTRPLRYHVNLDALLDRNQQSSPQRVLDRVESFVHETLIAHLGFVDKIGFVQDPPAHITVTDPEGREVGYSPQVGSQFSGSGYFEAGNRSVAWFLLPRSGDYKVTAEGQPGSSFAIFFSMVDLSRGASRAAVASSSANGVIPRSGATTVTFKGQAGTLLPQLRIGQSSTAGRPLAASVPRGTTVVLDGSNSVVPQGIQTARWEFGDGSSANGLRLTHQYTRSGVYTPRLTVTDVAGNIAAIEGKPVRVQ